MDRPSRVVHTSWLFVCIPLLFLAACADGSGDRDAGAGSIAVDDVRLVAADQDDENWLTYGRTYKEQRHSPLTQVDEETVGSLGLAWYQDMGTTRGLEGTPLVVDGVLYATGAWSVTYAFDAATGERPVDARSHGAEGALTIRVLRRREPWIGVLSWAGLLGHAGRPARSRDGRGR